LLEPAEKQFQCSINPTVYSSTEVAERLADGQSFLTRVMAEPRIDVPALLPLQ